VPQGLFYVDNTTVAGEAARHATFNATDARLQVLSTVGQLFSPIVIPNTDELAHSQVLRRLLASPGDPRHRHLGEAESLAIIEKRHAKQSVLVTDDDDATRLAKNRGIKPATTLGLLKVAYKEQILTDQQLSDALTILWAEGRKAPRPLGGLTAVRAWAKPL
jgi:hypothetical protein